MRTWPLLLLLALSLSGCATRLENSPDRPSPYLGDATLYRADQTILSSYGLLREFVRWEKNFRPLINDLKVKHAADNVRRHGKQWIASAQRMRDAYAFNPPDALAQDALTAALDVLNQALAESLGYMQQYTPTKAP